MSRTKDLLIEIGVEELPHSFCLKALEDFRGLFTDSLKGERIGYGEVREYCTPRRITLLIKDVWSKQQDFREEKRGPSVEKAYLPDGSPSKAMCGFLKSYGVDKKDVIEKGSGSGRYVYIVRELKGERTEKILPALFDRTLGSLKFVKTMKWESTGFMFARPIRWLLFLYGEAIIPYEVAGVKSDRTTYGHRSYGNPEIRISSPDEYEEKLASASVMADRYKRRENLKRQVVKLCEPRGLEVPDVGNALYDVNADLTELPNAVLCQFDEHFLRLPPEVLTSEMIEHQHYFPLVDPLTKKLSCFFIAVSNIKDNSESKYGYQRVLRARLDDGKFFFNEDKKHDLGFYLSNLKNVTFHEKLGSLYQKVERIGKIGEILVHLLALDEHVKKSVNDVVFLCKNDLLTLMVGEFPHLQGIMGYYYALSSGYPENVAVGIREHYSPRFAQDSLPSQIEGAIVGIADRLDTIMGIFSIGLKPRGSKDPFALRRQVLAIIRIIINLKLHFSINLLIGKIAHLYRIDKPNTVTQDIEEFFKNRTRSILVDMGFAYDEIDASMSGLLDDIYEAYRRILALHEFRKNRDFEDLLISFKRMSNIVKDEDTSGFSAAALREDEEKTLYRHFTGVRDRIVKNITGKNYSEVYKILASFKPVVDSFFDNVLVMEENPKLRENRIGLLKAVISVFSDIIDFSKIVLPGE